MKYGFIQAHRQEFLIVVMCDVLEVSRSGYYGWLHHESEKQERANR